jgi:hypothetical protein
MFHEVKMDMPSNIQEATEQVDRLRANCGQARGELRELEYILYRTVSLIHKLGLPPETEQVIQRVERMILLFRMLHTTMIYFEMGTPFGWALAVIGGISAAVSVGDFMMETR